MRFLLLSLFLVFVASSVQAQNNPLFGSQVTRMGSGYIRIAEVGQLVDTVSVWGDLQQTGKFLIPKGLALADLISLASGPTPIRSGDIQINWSDVILEVRVLSDGQFENPILYRFEYSKTPPIKLFKHSLKNADVVIVQVKRKRNYRDWIAVIAPSLQLVLTSYIVYDRLINN